MKNIIAASTSTVYGSGYLEYLLPEIECHFSGIDEVLFIAYARAGGATHDEYTQRVQNALNVIGKKVVGLHEFHQPIKAIQNAQAIFVGGGNTFLLVQQLYKNDLIAPLKEKLTLGTPYVGCSAGSNIVGLTMGTTNDMPIVQVPSYQTLGMLPFNINPHFLDTPIDSKHKGETREERIFEFHKHNIQPVIGLREGSWIEIKGDEIQLKGELTAKWFEQGKEPIEISPGKITL